MVTIQELVDEAAMTLADVAKEADISSSTISRMVNQKPVSVLSLRKVLFVLNRRLQTNYRISDIKNVELIKQPRVIPTKRARQREESGNE